MASSFRFLTGHTGQRCLRAACRFAWTGACAAIFSSFAIAADKEVPTRIWLNAGFLSFHADRSQDYREDNIGMGVELLMAPEHGFFAGNYINSDGTRSRYGMYQWRPLRWQIEYLELGAGFIAGAIDGYEKHHNGGWFFAVLPTLFLEGDRFGANLLFVPASKPEHRLVAIQLKIRVR